MSAYVKLEDTIDKAFGTVTPSTQAATDADSGPTCVVLEQGTALGYAPTVTNKAVGMYNTQIVCSAANGFEVGKQYTAYVVVTMATVVTRRPIASFTIMARSTDDLAFPTTTGRSTDVTATGAVGIDWGNVENPTTTINFSGSTIKTATDVETDTADIQTRLPAALVSGRIDSSTGAMAAGVLTAAAIDSDAITAAKLAADVTTELQAGLATAANVAAVETDTQNIQTRLPAALVSGRMDSSVGAMAADVITAASIAADAGVEFAAAVWAFAHETARTTKGVMVRLDAWLTGKATGLIGSTAAVYRADGVTKAVEATQNTAAGTRTQASTIAGD